MMGEYTARGERDGGSKGGRDFSGGKGAGGGKSGRDFSGGKGGRDFSGGKGGRDFGAAGGAGGGERAGRPAVGGRRDDDRRPQERGGNSASRGGVGRRGPDNRAERSGARLVPRVQKRPEPAIAEGITGRELDRGVHQQLRTLSKENAEGVAQHLVMVAVRLDEDDIDAAMAHAETAVRRAGRVPAAREALGMVAYRSGDWARALGEFRTVRRLSGSAHLLALMVDCERALGRPERALELATDPEAATLSTAERVELAIVISGVRRDLGQLDAAVVGLEPGLKGSVRPWSARLYYAYADALLARGDTAQARTWFAKAADADVELTTDANERLDELDGTIVTDLLGDTDEE